MNEFKKSYQRLKWLPSFSFLIFNHIAHATGAVEVMPSIDDIKSQTTQNELVIGKLQACAKASYARELYELTIALPAARGLVVDQNLLQSKIKAITANATLGGTRPSKEECLRAVNEDWAEAELTTLRFLRKLPATLD